MPRLPEFTLQALEGEVLAHEKLDLSERSVKLIRLPLTWLNGETPVSFLIQSEADNYGIGFKVLSNRPFEGPNFRPKTRVVDGEEFRPESLIYDHLASRVYGSDANRTFNLVHPTYAGGFNVLDRAGVQLAVGAAIWLPNNRLFANSSPEASLAAGH